MHPKRQARTEALNHLADQDEWEQYYQRLMLWEFPREARMGWQLAFLRTFAVPRMAQTLVDAGQLVDSPLKRAYDTGLIIYELVYGGTDSPRGRQMVSVMNRAHHGQGIVDEDMTYVLCAFMVTPLRYIQRTGWRPLTDNDQHASWAFYARLGKLMNIATIPDNYQAAAAFYDQYEAAMVAPSPAGNLLGTNLIKVLKYRFPAPARPVAAPLFVLLLADPAITEALGLTAPPQLLQRLTDKTCAVFGTISRRLPPRTTGIFTPGMATDKHQYPNGYHLSDLGPAETRKSSLARRPSNASHTGTGADPAR